MSTRRRRPDATETSSPEASARKRVRAPEFDSCNFYSEAVNLIFDPKRVLLRRLFFIDEDRTKYFSVGFYPARDYHPFVEFGSIKKNGSTILILDDQQVDKMAECLPRLCESMCGNEQYGCKEGDFRLNTTGSYRIAPFYLDKQYTGLRLGDLQYLSRMCHVVQNQLKVYTLSLLDILAYMTVALTSVNYVEPAPNASKHIVYSQLFVNSRRHCKKNNYNTNTYYCLTVCTCLHSH